ncbi:MAG: hypothetical protein K5931_05810 [Lachnospiraceae bacterium]|nr:hypothetical protein [Lachnospiraceae bacterium]
MIYIISTLNTEGRDFVTVLESYTTSTVSWIYYVENSECKESSASGIGSFSKCDYAKGYCVSLGAYDAMYEYEEGKRPGKTPISAAFILKMSKTPWNLTRVCKYRVLNKPFK